MNYGSEPADQVVRYSLEGAEFALRISGTAAKNFFIFAQAVLHDSKKTHGKTHLIRLLKEQKPLKFFTVDKDRMHDFARAAKAHGLLFCPIRDKMDPDHIEIAILQDDASKANRIIDKLQLAIVDTGTAELIDTVQQERGEPAPETERVQTEDGAVDFEIGADEEQFNMGFPQGSENASPSEPFSDSSKSFANSLSPRADQLRAKGERPSVRMELSDITAYLRRKVEPPKDRMPKIVTMDMGEQIATHYGLRTINVLTGFKFIGEQIGKLEKQGRADSYVFGFEESYGYLTGSYVRDKDGVDGAYMICEMFSYYATKGISLLDKLDELYKTYGYCLNTLHSYEFDGSAGFAKMQSIMQAFRGNIKAFGGKKVVKLLDYAYGLDGLPKSEVLKFLLEDNCSIVVRPSGTEPKLKIYISVSAENREAAEKVECEIVKDAEKWFA